MKFLCVLAFVAVLAVCSVNAQSHNVTFGYIGPYDPLLHRQFVGKFSKWLQVVSEDLTYPPKGFKQNRKISGIRVIDQYRNGTGGYATLYSGGPGFNYTTLHFKSQRSRGFSFIVDIYGR